MVVEDKLAKYWKTIAQKNDYSPYKQACTSIVASIGKDKEILEIGVGAGNLALFLSRYMKCVYGIDRSKLMIEIAKKSTNRKKVFLFKKNAENFSLNKKFDAIVCFQGPVLFVPAGNKPSAASGILAYSGIKKMFALSYKHLKPGGLLFVQNKPDMYKELKMRLGEKDCEIYNKINGEFLIRNYEIKQNGKSEAKIKIKLKILSKNKLEKIIEQCGFRKIKHTKIFYVYKRINPGNLFS